ncbi:unnamed protein product, partial [Discosporangium mesarthrocarpum]
TGGGSGSGDDWLRQQHAMGVGLAESPGEPGMGPAGSGAVERFLQELVEGAAGSPALALSQWVAKHVGENPILARMGGPLVARSVRGAAAAMLWHSGYAVAAQRMAAALTAADDGRGTRGQAESLTPPFFLLETWRKAAGLKSWAKSRRDRGTGYDATAASLSRQCRFLLALHPASGDQPVGWLVQEFKAATAAAAATATADPGSSGDGLGGMGAGTGAPGLLAAPAMRRWSSFSSASDAGGGSLVRALEGKLADCLSLVTAFLKDSIDLCGLRAAQVAADERAGRRAEGMLALRSLLGVSGGCEGFSSGVKLALLLHLPPALRGMLHGLAALGPDSIALQVVLEAARSGVSGVMEKLMGCFLEPRLSQVPGGHYLAGLSGCCRMSTQKVRGAFEKLYAFLAGELESAVQQDDTSLQFLLIDAWGVVVHEDDHDLLARVGIFNILQ